MVRRAWLSGVAVFGLALVWASTVRAQPPPAALDLRTPLVQRIGVAPPVREVARRFDQLVDAELSGVPEADLVLLSETYPKEARALASELDVLLERSDLEAFHPELRWRQAHLLLRYHTLIGSIPRPERSASTDAVMLYKIFRGDDMRSYAGLERQALEELRRVAALEGPWAERARRDLQAIALMSVDRT